MVSLAIAFETLLTDGYAPGVKNRVISRVGVCLKGKKGVGDYKAAVGSIMEARGAIVHNGSSARQVEITKSQAAFALCVMELTNRLDSLPTVSGSPIGDILDS